MTHGMTSDAPLFITGESIGLRALQLTDLEGRYIHWLNDPEVCEFNSHHVFPYSKDQGQAYVNSTHGDRQNLVLAVILRATGEHIGNIALQKINYVDRNAEFAILMGEKRHWGKGYAKEAAYLICRHGFSALNLHRIYCGTNADNIGMQKLAEFMGMQPEGTYRQAQFKNGRYMDVKRYGVLRAEFEQKFGAIASGCLAKV